MATVTSLGFSIISRWNDRGTQQAAKGLTKFGQKVATISEKAEEALGKFDEQMEKVGLAGGLALGAGLVRAVDATDAQAKLQAQLGLTAKESQRLGKVAGSVYSQAYGESIDEVNDAIGAVVSSIGGMRSASDSAVSSMTKRALTLSKAFEVDVSRSVQVVGQLVKSGLVKDATQGFDLLTAVFQKVPAAVREDVLDALDEYSPFLNQIGLKGQQAFELLAQSAAKGMYGIDKTGDALKEFTIRATDMSSATKAAYDTLGLSQAAMTRELLAGGQRGAAAFQKIITGLQKIKDPAKQSQAALALFGTPLEDLNTGEIPKFLRSLDTTRSSLGNTAGAADRAGAALQNTASQRFTAFKRSLETNITQTIGNDVLPMLDRLKKEADRFGIDSGDLIKAALAMTALAATIKTVTYLTTAWAAAQMLVNLAMKANVFGLILIILVAVGAGLVLLWKKSETFRNIVLGTWNAIKTAIAAAWTFVKPVFDLLKWYFTVVLVGALKLYWGYVTFVFNAVWNVIKFAWGIIKPIFDVIVAVVTGVLSRAWIILKNAVKIVWIAIQVAIKVAWAIIKPIFDRIQTVIRSYLAPAFNWLWSKVISPVWTKVRNHISTIYNSGIKPVFNRLKQAVDDVRRGFKVAVDAIGRIWGGLKSIAKKPVNFVIGLYNDGVVKLVNKLADFAGVKTRLEKIPKFARGGTLADPMPARPMMTNGAMAIVGEGRRSYPEYVIPTDPRFRGRARHLWAAAGRDLMSGGHDWTRGRDALGGEGLAFAGGGTLQALAFGGIIGRLVKGVKNWTIGNVGKAAKGVLDKVLGGTVPGSGIFRDLVAAIPGKLEHVVLDWIKSKISGGPGMEKALKFARSQAGKPYIWGGVGPAGYDCSGFMSAITNIIQGRSPYSRRFTTFSFTGAKAGPAGFVRGARSGFGVGVTNAGLGHMAGTLLGHAVESSGSYGVRVDGGARGAGDRLFNLRYGLRADSGALTLAPGWNPPTYNGTGRMEYLETPRRQQGEAKTPIRREGPLVSIGEVVVKEKADVDMVASTLGFAARAVSFS